MVKCAIIGGGLAGLSSAVHLCKAGLQVNLFESSPKLGGRAYSFFDEQSSTYIDNGQHIMMGCYYNTIEFLKIIDSLDKVFIQDKLNIKFIDQKKKVVPLKAFTKAYPLNLLIGLLNYKALPFSDRIKIIKSILKLAFSSIKNYQNFSVSEWLEQEKHTQTAIKNFWEILVVGALNSKIDIASASIFCSILKKIFFGGNKAASIILPDCGLSELFCENAKSYIEKHHGKVFLSNPVDSIIVKNGAAEGLTYKNGTSENFDFIISAVPQYSLEKLIKQDLTWIEKDQLKYSPIISVHLWLNKKVFSDKFYGLLGSPVHWIFNHEEYITIVISSAESLINLKREEIINIIVDELEKYFLNFSRSLIIRERIIKEKRATFIPDLDALNNRSEITSEINRLFITGDWVNTNLPGTIESAVLSGKKAAELIIHNTNCNSNN